MSKGSEAPKELYVAIFPCGALYVDRTEQAATSQALDIAKKQTCCFRGHGAFKVERWRPEGVVCSFVDRKLTSETKLRVVK